MNYASYTLTEISGVRTSANRTNTWGFTPFSRLKATAKPTEGAFFPIPARVQRHQELEPRAYTLL